VTPTPAKDGSTMDADERRMARARELEAEKARIRANLDMFDDKGEVCINCSS
jgi:hypothetical protein